MRLKSILAATAAAFIAQSAFAADMGAPPPLVRPLPPPIFTWTGGYLGINGGYGYATADATLTVTTPFLAVSGTGSSGNMSGPIAGGQIGGNYQAGFGVFGIEVDGQWSNQKSAQTSLCGVGCAVTETTKVKAFATARARAGVAMDRVLIYVTGGGAWTAVSDVAIGTVGTTTVNVWTINGNKAGWTVGAGIEGAFYGTWSMKAEYLFISTENIRGTGTLPTGLGTVTGSINVQDHIVRLGINYRFGPAVVAAY